MAITGILQSNLNRNLKTKWREFSHLLTQLPPWMLAIVLFLHYITRKGNRELAIQSCELIETEIGKRDTNGEE